MKIILTQPFSIKIVVHLIDTDSQMFSNILTVLHTVPAQLKRRGSIFKMDFWVRFYLDFWLINWFFFSIFLLMKTIFDWGCINFSIGWGSIQEWPCNFADTVFVR